MAVASIDQAPHLDLRLALQGLEIRVAGAPGEDDAADHAHVHGLADHGRRERAARGWERAARWRGRAVRGRGRASGPAGGGSGAPAPVSAAPIVATTSAGRRRRVGDRAGDRLVVVEGDVQRAAAIALGRALARALAVHAADRLLVVVEVGPGAGRLADAVGASVEGERGGGAVVAGVALLGRAVDLEVEQPGVVGGVEVLDHLDRPGLAGVGDRAGDRRRRRRRVTFSGPPLVAVGRALARALAVHAARSTFVVVVEVGARCRRSRRRCGCRR